MYHCVSWPNLLLNSIRSSDLCVNWRLLKNYFLLKAAHGIIFHIWPSSWNGSAPPERFPWQHYIAFTGEPAEHKSYKYVHSIKDWKSSLFWLLISLQVYFSDVWAVFHETLNSGGIHKIYVLLEKGLLFTEVENIFKAFVIQSNLVPSLFIQLCPRKSLYEHSPKIVLLLPLSWNTEIACQNDTNHKI